MTSLAGKATIRGTKKLYSDVSRARKKLKKAQSDAVKIVAYRRLRDMAREMRRGAPGGQSFEPLSTIARVNFRNKSLMSSRKPFTGLASTQRQGGFLRGLPPIRYTPIAGADGLVKKAEIGMTNEGRYPSGSNWIRKGNVWQEGTTVPVDDADKRVLRYIGAAFKKARPNSVIARRFFLKKATRSVKHPQREIILPFWRRWRQPSIEELQQVFAAKAAGKRV